MQSGPTPSVRRPAWVLAVLVFGATLAAYWPALGGGVLWDDPAHLTVPELRSWSGLGRILTQLGATQEYYPFLHGAFWVEHRLWGDWLPGYHLLNLALHAASACLLALVLRQLWRRGAAAEAAPHAAGWEWLAAFAFALHPVAVESVAWITEQKNTLSVFFYLLAALAYLKFDDNRRGRDYALALLAFFFALGAKTATFTLPPALLVLLWWRRGAIQWRRDVVPLLPWFALAVAAGLVTIQVETNFVGAKGTAYALTLGERLLLAPRIVWFYVGKNLWPQDLLFFYPRWDVPAQAARWWPYALATLAVTALALGWAVRRGVRGPLASWLLFLGAMFPVIGFFNVFAFLFSYVADHFQYMPCLTFVAGATCVVAWAGQRLGPRGARVLAGLAIAVVVAFAVETHRLSALYLSNETLFGHVVARNPGSWMAHEILATANAKAGRSAEAIAHYSDVVRLKPDHPDAYLGLALEIGRQPGRREEALALYEHAVALRPHYVEAHYNYGITLATDPARRAEAIAHLRVAAGVRPAFFEAQTALGNLLARDRATVNEALEHFETALRFRPDVPAIHRDYADALARAGRIPDATKEYQAALELNAGDAVAHFHLADVLVTQPGRMTDAVAEYERSLRLDPALADAHAHLASVLARLPGRGPEAMPHAEEAVKLKPLDPESHNLLGILYAQQGDLARARHEWETALRLDSRHADARQNLERLEAMLRQAGG